VFLCGSKAPEKKKAYQFDPAEELRTVTVEEAWGACPALASQLHGYASRKFLSITEMS
jgi:hypothetical protein